MIWKHKQLLNKKNNEFSEYSPEILQLLFNRGIDTKEKIKQYFEPSYDSLGDPFLFRDMEKFVKRVESALANQEVICVYGDYDTDGVTSSVLIIETLKKIGIKNVFVYIPHREQEGYGLNKKALDYIKEQKTSLLITVDCGTSNVEEVAYARKLGMDVVIMDHHQEPAKLPQDVVAFLNPHLKGEKYPFAGFAACGVCYKAVQAMWKHFKLPQGMEKWFLDLVAIATVADMMDLQGENRNLVKHGLIVLNKTKRLGLLSLLQSAEVSVGGLGVYEIGFRIAPRINSAGRLDHANTAFELLETENIQTAKKLAQDINFTNSNRQSETESIINDVIDNQIKTQVDKNNFVLTAIGESWPPGVVGLVSSRITEKYHRPSLVITNSSKGWVGSGRSIRGFNITDALGKCSQYLSKFGGHDGACGFSLKSGKVVLDFSKKMNLTAKEELTKKDLEKTLLLDMDISLSKIDFDFAANIEKFSPFGMGNPKPKFSSVAARVCDVKEMGQNGKHLKIKFEQSEKEQEAVFFSPSQELKEKISIGSLLDIAYEVDINEWRGQKKIQLKIIDIKSS